VRELRNVVENFVLSRALPPLGDAAGAQATQLADLGALPYAEAKRIAIRRFQEAYVRPILLARQGDLRAAAERMGLSLPGLKKVLAELEGSAEADEKPVAFSHQPDAPTTPAC
jgi:DNA-binding NtrC family response regulator